MLFLLLQLKSSFKRNICEYFFFNIPYYLSLHKGMVLTSQICFPFALFVLSLVEIGILVQAKVLKVWKVKEQTNDIQNVIRKAYLRFQLRWAKKCNSWQFRNARQVSYWYQQMWFTRSKSFYFKYVFLIPFCILKASLQRYWQGWSCCDDDGISEITLCLCCNLDGVRIVFKNNAVFAFPGVNIKYS